ncbi:MAG: hypothetical protein JXA21_21930 [Anaerolineae bacterium]|nr:hypothetical protein [Anaerolineae bacterium]
MALKDKVIPADFVLDEAIASAIRSHLKDSTLACATAFIIAAELDRPPLLIGQTADALALHLSHCQLGLFGYPGHKKGWDAANIAARPVPEGLEDALREVVRDGILTCPAAWQLAARYAIPKMLVSYVADRLGFRIAGCQLGVF